MNHTPKPSFSPFHQDSCTEVPSYAYGSSNTSRSVSKLLIAELDELCSSLRDLDAKLNSRLALIMLDSKEPVSDNPVPCYGGFSPLFNNLRSGIAEAQSLVAQINASLDRVDEL